MPVLRSGAYGVLPHAGSESRNAEDLVRNVAAIADAKQRDIILFAVKCSRNPQRLEEDDFDKLRRHGLEQSEIVEVIAMSALAVYANIIADATAMEEDEMFATV